MRISDPETAEAEQELKVTFVSPDNHQRSLRCQVQFFFLSEALLLGQCTITEDAKHPCRVVTAPMIAHPRAPILGADSEAIYGDRLGCSRGEVRVVRQGKVI